MSILCSKNRCFAIVHDLSEPPSKKMNHTYVYNGYNILIKVLIELLLPMVLQHTILGLCPIVNL